MNKYVYYNIFYAIDICMFIFHEVGNRFESPERLDKLTVIIIIIRHDIHSLLVNAHPLTRFDCIFFLQLNLFYIKALSLCTITAIKFG